MHEPVLDYDTLHPGQRYPAVPCHLDERLVEGYLQATAAHHPLYAQGYVPPLITSMVRWVKASLGGRWPTGTVHLSQHLELLRPLRRGDTLHVDVCIGDKEQRHGRRYVQLHTTTWDADQQPVVRGTMHMLWAGAEQAAASGSRAFAPEKRPRPVKETDPEGQRLAPVTVTFSRAMVEAYGEVAAARDPLHLDPAYARQTRFGANIVQGLLVLSLLSRLLVQAFGTRWLSSSTLQARFARPVFVGEPVTAEGVALATQPGRCLVWCINARGERVITGEAVL